MGNSIDREKVVKALMACTGEENDCAGHTCPYWDFDGEIGCRTQMELDALSLLTRKGGEDVEHTAGRSVRAMSDIRQEDENAKSLLDEWQKRLGLTDWRIKLSTNCEPQEMEMSDVCGCTSWQEATRTAHIYIADEKYYGDRVIPFDFEEILIHELLHLKTCLLFDTGNELQDRIAHQLIDDLARAFVNVKEGR